MDMLTAGNQRFASGHTTIRDWPSEVHATASGQFPYAAVVSCMDSRTSMEVVLDQLIESRQVELVGGMYDIDTGRVTFFTR